MLGMRTLKTAFSKMSLATTSSKGASITTAGIVGSYLNGASLPIGMTTNTSSFTTTTSRCLSTVSTVSCSSSASGLFKNNSSSLTPATLSMIQKVDSIPLAREFSTTTPKAKSLMQMHRTGPIKKKRPNKNPLGDKPMARGVILKTLVKKPRKPNSANRKCVLVRLTTGREMLAYVPGEGHNLQEHNIVLVRVGRLRDVPGVKLKCIRGKFDLPHVIKRKA